MKNCRLLLLSIFLVLGHSCDVKKESDHAEVLILNFEESDANLDDLLTRHYIKLVGDSEISQKPIIQVDYALDRIFVLAGGPDGHFSAFDLSGNFIQHIGKRGKERGEFVIYAFFGVSKD